MRITNQMMDNVSVYNLNTNKALLDDLNNQMSTRKKINDPTKDPVTAVSSLRYRGSLSEYTQYLGKNVTDAASWTDSTRAAIDTAKELMRSLKAEYTSASNGTNENTDRWTYYDNMVNVVNEYFSVGDTTNENRYLFSGARTGDSLTFSEKNFSDRAKKTNADSGEEAKYDYVAIKELFELNDIESYSYTVKVDNSGNALGSSGITDDDITTVTSETDETRIQDVNVFRLRLSYENLDAEQTYYSENASTKAIEPDSTKSYELEFSDGTSFEVELIASDSEKSEADFTGANANKIYLNTTTGNLLFGTERQEEISKKLASGATASFKYNKTGDSWKETDAKPEHYFECYDIGLGKGADNAIKYQNSVDPSGGELLSYRQEINYNVGEGMQVRVNSNADQVFTLDARRDLNEMRDALTTWDEAKKKVARLQEMQEDKMKYDTTKQMTIADLLKAAEKETEYAKEKVDTMLSNGITRSGNYFDVVNLAGTEMGTSINRLNLIRNRLTEHQATSTAQASDNENIDISTVAVEVNAATISFSAALQVTGKISQQSLVNFL